MEYPKLNSLFKRDHDTHKFTEEFSKPEFGSQQLWRIEEKIDGMNIRVYIDGLNKVVTDIKGRTDAAKLPPQLRKYFSHHEQFNTTFKNMFLNGPTILYGEGFGKGIQSGGIYRNTVAFMLFDIYLCGRWATREEVHDVALMLGFDHPHDYGLKTTEETLMFVKRKPLGNYGNADYPSEGIVARSEPLVRFNDRSANPVMWKLKVRDFD